MGGMAEAAAQSSATTGEALAMGGMAEVAAQSSATTNDGTALLL